MFSLKGNFYKFPINSNYLTVTYLLVSHKINSALFHKSIYTTWFLFASQFFEKHKAIKGFISYWFIFSCFSSWENHYVFWVTDDQNQFLLNYASYWQLIEACASKEYHRPSHPMCLLNKQSLILDKPTRFWNVLCTCSQFLFRFSHF